MGEEVRSEVIAALRAAGARFAYLHGSRAAGTAREDSDVDVAAWFGTSPPPRSWEVDGLPGPADLLVLDSAPLELAGRVALGGRLLFDDDPPARVRWEAMTRKVWADEAPRREQARRDFAETWSTLSGSTASCEASPTTWPSSTATRWTPPGPAPSPRGWGT